MFSSRIAWSLEPSALSQATESRRGTLLDLTQSNPTAAGITHSGVLEALHDPGVLRYQPTALGLPAAREAVAAYTGASASGILLTASTSEAYSYLFKLLCNPGDKVLVPRPSYPLFEFLAQLENVEVAQYPMYYADGWYIDLDALRSLVDPRTKGVVFVNPNNPTGSYLKRAEYEALVALGLPLIVDEVFADYAFSEDSQRIATVAGRSDTLTFSLSGLSKVSALPQMKLGWIVASGPRSAEALQRLELIADTFLSVGAPVQHAAPALLAMRHEVQRQIRARTLANLETLTRLAHDTPACVLNVEGGWYATLQVPRTRSEEEWVLHLLTEHGTLVQPGYFFDFDSEAFLVLSLLTEPHIFNEGAIRTILATKG